MSIILVYLDVLLKDRVTCRPKLIIFVSEMKVQMYVIKRIEELIDVRDEGSLVYEMKVQMYQLIIYVCSFYEEK